MYQPGFQQKGTDSCSTFAKNKVFTFKPKSKMTSIKARLNRSRAGKDGMFPLVIQVIRHRVKREVYTPYRLRAIEFDTLREITVTGRDRSRASYLREANEYLMYIKEAIEETEHSLAQQGDYTADDLTQAYKSRSDRSRFFVYGDQKINELIASGKKGTAANYRSAINAFARFLGNTELLLNDLTKKKIEEFIAYLAKEGNSPNTIACYVKQLRALYNKADDDGYVHSAYDPFHCVKLKGNKTAKRAISKQDIKKIVDLDLTGKHKHLVLARDIFLFSLYTRGMAFVDMCHLTKENIKGNVLLYRRQKTGQLLQMRIEPPLRALLTKYADEDSPFLLPMLRRSDSYEEYKYMARRLNKRIREIGDMLEFDFPLTFYVARHSWATSAHDQGIPLSVISESMGHTSEKTTRIYLAELDTRTIDQANKKVINYWNG